MDAEQTILEQHRRFLDLELRKLRRCKLLQMHLLDQSLLSEVCLVNKLLPCGLFLHVLETDSWTFITSVD